jgi:hypothetical protein
VAKKTKKKGKKGKGGGDDSAAAPQTRLKPVPSLFRFFEPAAQPGASRELDRMLASEIEVAEDDSDNEEVGGAAGGGEGSGRLGLRRGLDVAQGGSCVNTFLQARVRSCMCNGLAIVPRTLPVASPTGGARGG